MRTRQYGTIYQLTFLPRAFPINCYLVEEDTELTLIDAGMPFSKKGILQAIEKIGKPLTRIVLTHAHGDHVGALDGLKQDLPNVKVYISKRDSLLLAGNKNSQPGEPQTQIKGDVPKSIKTIPEVLLEDGDRIGSLQAIATPGHTPGHMAFIDVRNKALIAGDAMQTRGGIAVSGTVKWMFPFPAMATWHKQSALDSVRKLSTLQPSLLAIGHGNVILNPAKALEQAINEAEKALR
ncbi:MBL fold metallo-hydrolase [Paenibacillus psychroresistens]|uniref:MBL fold metallo-hydrolase n=1 Tax=Paenibacillus psychroresistens TaxID=1778678 RepID=A0A6B8RQ88_9BACL|nr:MBL fold metallo-hydrolase [Paenibacillus psychroresistens]QGQ97964.1 MBL fold metallo-hydrolase [Paenibacillus psychroresistens]